LTRGFIYRPQKGQKSTFWGINTVSRLAIWIKKNVVPPQVIAVKFVEKKKKKIIQIILKNIFFAFYAPSDKIR
jgi:hypothetical protein